MAKSRKRGLWTRILRGLTLALAGFVVLSVIAVGTLRWVDPPTSAFILKQWIIGQLQPGDAPRVHHEWADWSQIPAAVKLAVIAAEDQRFPDHRGFDTVELQRALAAHQAGARLRGASTITQQTAKNLFLWSGRDPLRKILEAWFAVLIEVLWSKERILEIYLNIAQFSPDTFGVGAASWRYFDRPVVALGPEQAALLAAVLPNPLLYRLDAPSAYVKSRAQRIRRDMTRLGGSAYLRRL